MSNHIILSRRKLVFDANTKVFDECLRESSWRELRIHNPGDRAVSMQAIGDLALSIANWRSCRIDHT